MFLERILDITQLLFSGEKISGKLGYIIKSNAFKLKFQITAVRTEEFTFIDLFAGIGGMRQAFEAAGCRCVFSSEWDKYSQQTYFENFNDFIHGDKFRSLTCFAFLSDFKE